MNNKKILNKIVYIDKQNFQELPTIPEYQKATAKDFNQIKNIVNSTIDEINLNISPEIQELEKSTVKLTTNQFIDGIKTFINSGGAITFNAKNQSQFLEFKNNNISICFIGKLNESNNDISIVSNSGKLFFSANQGCFFESLISGIQNPINDDNPANKIYVDDNDQKLNSLILNLENLLNNLAKDFNKLRPFNFKGKYDPNFSYLKNDAVDDPKGYLFISVIDNNLNNPLTDENSWISAGPEIDLTDYYSKIVIDQKLNLKADKTETSAIDAKLAINISNITKNAADILLKADKTETSAIDAKLAINISNITKNAADILLKADKTELVNKQDKLTAGTNISIVDNVISSTGGGGGGDVTIDTAQNITGIKTFTNGIKNNLVEVNGKSLIVKNSGGGSNYFEIEQTYTSGYKNWFGVLFFRTTGTSREELSSIQVRQDDGLYISTGNDLIFNAANIKFNNARLQQVRTPTADDDAATKKYADDGLSLKVDKTEIAAIDAKLVINTNNITKNAADILLKADKTDVVDLTSYQEITGQKDFKDAASFYGNLYCFRAPVDKYGVINKENLDKELVYKQNTLIAGTGIDITGDTISSTTVVSPDTALTSKTNTFDFRQVIKSGGSGLLDLQNSTGSVLNTTYDLASTSVKLTSPNTTSMTFTAKDFNFSDKEIKNVGTPITNKSAANKEYVDTNLALKADKLVVPINASADTSTTINDRVVKVVYKEYTSTGDSVVASTSAGFGYLNASIIRKKSDNSWGIVYNDEFNEVYITSSNQIRFNIKTLAGYTNEIKLTIQHN